MNETFGFSHLPSYDISKRHTEEIYNPNEKLIEHLKDIINYNLMTDFVAYQGTFLRMKEIYHKGFMRCAKEVQYKRTRG